MKPFLLELAFGKPLYIWKKVPDKDIWHCWAINSPTNGWDMVGKRRKSSDTEGVLTTDKLIINETAREFIELDEDDLFATLL